MLEASDAPCRPPVLSKYRGVQKLFRSETLASRRPPWGDLAAVGQLADTTTDTTDTTTDEEEIEVPDSADLDFPEPTKEELEPKWLEDFAVEDLAGFTMAEIAEAMEDSDATETAVLGEAPSAKGGAAAAFGEEEGALGLCDYDTDLGPPPAVDLDDDCDNNTKFFHYVYPDGGTICDGIPVDVSTECEDSYAVYTDIQTAIIAAIDDSIDGDQVIVICDGTYPDENLTIDLVSLENTVTMLSFNGPVVPEGVEISGDPTVIDTAVIQILNEGADGAKFILGWSDVDLEATPLDTDAPSHDDWYGFTISDGANRGILVADTNETEIEIRGNIIEDNTDDVTLTLVSGTEHGGAGILIEQDSGKVKIILNEIKNSVVEIPGGGAAGDPICSGLGILAAGADVLQIAKNWIYNSTVDSPGIIAIADGGGIAIRVADSFSDGPDIYHISVCDNRVFDNFVEDNLDLNLSLRH